MDSFLYVMAIMGCADDGSLCQQQRFAPTRYASRTACQQDAAAQLGRHSDLPFPTLIATCQPAGNRFAALDGEGRPR